MTNPFTPNGAAPANPYAQPQQAPANPYAQQAPANPYAQQAQQQAPAQYTQQPAQQPQQGGLVARPGSFVRPSAPVIGQGGSFPKVSDFNGRLLLILPERIERQLSGKYGEQDRLTCTIVVLDGGPFAYGGNAHNTPHVIKNFYFQQGPLIRQLEEALAMRLRGEAGLALGRLWKTGPGNSDPYVLADPDQQDGAAFDAYVSQVNPFNL